MRRYLNRTITLLLLAGSVGIGAPAGAAPLPFADPAFQRVWTHSDGPVARGDVARSWFWGPEPATPSMEERYLESPGTGRLIQYFDKGRMEINDPAADPTNPWYVTSGLIDRELISGRIQIGDATFLDTGSGARVPVAGDPTNLFPTYADLQRVVDQGQSDQTGGYATTVLLPDGESTRPDATSDAKARFAQYVSYPGPQGSPVGYNIPRAFWDFMTQPGLVQDGSQTRLADPLFDWLFVLGYPIADPVWVQVQVAGRLTWVLVQPFERRLLTYTPSNPLAWQVEMGNIGQHYLRWRYEYTPPAGELGGNLPYLAIKEGNSWRYSTSEGIDEQWQFGKATRAFSGGTTVLPRWETRGSSRVRSYWSSTLDGLSLYGHDRLDAEGNVAETTVYWPPIRYFPGNSPYIGQSWSIPTRVISSSGPARQMTVSVQIAAWQKVSTPAGIVDAWKLAVTEWTGDDPTRPIQHTTNLWLAPNVGVAQWHNERFAAQLLSASTLGPKP